LKPESDKAVRGVVHLAGWFWENLPGNKCRATLINEADIKGSIP
jgi:hypothetical protein